MAVNRPYGVNLAVEPAIWSIAVSASAIPGAEGFAITAMPISPSELSSSGSAS